MHALLFNTVYHKANTVLYFSFRAALLNQSVGGSEPFCGNKDINSIRDMTLTLAWRLVQASYFYKTMPPLQAAD